MSVNLTVVKIEPDGTEIKEKSRLLETIEQAVIEGVQVGIALGRHDYTFMGAEVVEDAGDRIGDDYIFSFAVAGVGPGDLKPGTMTRIILSDP